MSTGVEGFDMYEYVSPACRLATWVQANYAGREPLTHLKLQKLVFYCHGIAAAFEHDLGEVVFEPWEHGPVNREIWHQYKHFGGRPIERAEGAVRPFAPTRESVLKSVLKIYGRLDAWSLRQQSHLERPWIEAFSAQSHRIEPVAIRRHFEQVYQPGNVQAPEYVLNSGSFWLDGIPLRPYRSLSELAASLPD